MVIYQFSNSTQIAFIVLFIILIVICTVIGVVCFPLLKMILCGENPIKPRILLSCICIPIYILCITLFILGIKNISQYYNATKNTNIEKCKVVSGEIVEIEKIPQYSRGADLTSYHLTFTIGNKIYYIDTDTGVDLQNIENWNIGEQVVVYYQIDNDKNEVIRVEKEKTGDGSMS